MGTNPKSIDTDNDGFSDPHDGFPLDLDKPTNHINFKDYQINNPKVEYAITKWLKDDELDVIKDITDRIPVQVAADLIYEILYNAIQKALNWQIAKVTESINEKDVNIYVKINLPVTLPDASWSNKPKFSLTKLPEISKENLPKFGLKRYNISLSYNLIYYDNSIIDYEIDIDSFEWEEIK